MSQTLSSRRAGKNKERLRVGGSTHLHPGSGYKKSHAADFFVSAATLLLCVSYLDHRERSVLPLRRLHLVRRSFPCL